MKLPNWEVNVKKEKKKRKSECTYSLPCSELNRA